MNVSYTHFRAANEVMSDLTKLRRWTDTKSEARYNELAKQGLNTIIAYILALYLEKEHGKKIHYENFPKIAIGRAFAKAFVYYDTPEHKIDEICQLGKVKKSGFDSIAEEIIAEKTDKEFANFLANSEKEEEVRIYKAATKIATYIEACEQNSSECEDEIERKLAKFYTLPGVREFSDKRSPVFEMLQQISGLRNQARWATSKYNLECSVLGHLFDTAVFAYLMAMEETEDETYATRMFFMGIWHDVAEAWTKDIPSPIKDRISGYREATEEYEVQQLEKNLYSVITPKMKEQLKTLMLEEEENEAFKAKIKAADYLSANSECWRNIISGSFDSTFARAILRDIKSLSPIGKELHNKFCEVAQMHLEIAKQFEI